MQKDFFYFIAGVILLLLAAYSVFYAELHISIGIIFFLSGFFAFLQSFRTAKSAKPGTYLILIGGSIILAAPVLAKPIVSIVWKLIAVYNPKLKEFAPILKTQQLSWADGFIFLIAVFFVLAGIYIWKDRYVAVGDEIDGRVKKIE